MAAYQASGLVRLPASASLLWLLDGVRRGIARQPVLSVEFFSLILFSLFFFFIFIKDPTQAHNLEIPMDLSTCPSGRRRQQHFPRHPHDHHHEISTTEHHSSSNTTLGKITFSNSGRDPSKSKVVFRFIGNTLDFRSAV